METLAVFAAKVAGADGAAAADVATLDQARLDKLKAVFWEMTNISSEVEAIHHSDSNPDDGIDDSWTERILHIMITAKAAAEVPDHYGFTPRQSAALEELLRQRSLLMELVNDISIRSPKVADLLNNLPDDISPKREAAIRAACSLVGKVNYFWGGKSAAIGWDSRWGEIRKVTAEGSPSTGTYRPYGLDCSGFVDWVFHNALDYVIGHGGGVASQHSYCEAISWEETMIGDLVFYPEDSHMGFVAGWDDEGDLLIVHCASGYNNVMVTGIEGFIKVGRLEIL